jgi:DnaK suppressor protein
MAAKKQTSKSAKPAKKAPAKKAPAKNAPVKKAPTKKAPAKKATAKKAPAKKAPAKKAPAKKAPAKKAPAKKAPAKKAPAKKAPAKKAPAKKAPAKKAPVKKALVKKSPVKKAEPKAITKPAPLKKASTPKVSTTKAELKKTAPKKKVAAINGSDSSTPVLIKSPHSVAFIQKQHQRLLDLRDDLVDAMSGMTRDTIRNAPEGSEASGSGMHQGDAGSDAYDRDFALSILAKEQDALYEIEQALRRIKQGNYGVCELSGEKIPQPRLEAIPFARLTVQCQAQWEKEYGNRRFRPSNEVGFSGGNTLDDEDSDAVLLDEDDE